MFYKKFAFICILSMILILLNVKAHWVDDTGPIVVLGDQNNLTTDNGGDYYTEWKYWKIIGKMKDSKNMDVLKVEIKHTKNLNYNEKKCEGHGYCEAWSAEKMSGKFTIGKFDVHAQARGKWWYASDREKNSYFAGGTFSADEDAERDRWLNNPTYSGVHLKGRAYINMKVNDNDSFGVTNEMNWF